MSLTVGVDASNIRAGGGLTHLSQLIRAAQPQENRIERVVVWGSEHTLSRLPAQDWLDKVHVPLLDGPLTLRLFWQRVMLPSCLRQSGCDVLFSPGGTLPWRIPLTSVAMSQNLLPFEYREAARFGVPSRLWLKMMLLRGVQSRSMERADGLIFLSRYAKDTVLSVLRRYPSRTVTIPHGIEERFFKEPRPAVPLSEFSALKPFRILYVSPVDVHKHQRQVAQAVGLLREKGLPVEVSFVGSARSNVLRRLRDTLEKVDPVENFAHYKGPTPFDELHETYHQADAFVFASSCENLPNILLEAMAAGLPIACSNMGPMPDVLGDAGTYFDPERTVEIAEALNALIEQDDLRSRLAREAHARAKAYSWESCASETFAYLAECARLSKDDS